MEILRRVLVVAGMFLALWWALVPVGPLVRVEAAEGTAREGETRVRVADSSWNGVVRAASSVAAGGVPEPPYADRVGRRFSRPALYLAPEDPPVRELRAQIESHTTLFVEVAGSAVGLRALWTTPFDARGLEPARLLRPMRGSALWVLLGTVAVYAALPRRRLGPSTAYYHRVRAVVLPDVLATLLTGLFVAIPMLVVPTSSPAGGLFHGDWAALTVTCWAMAGFGLALYAAAAWYATLRFEVGADAIERVTLLGRESIPLSEVVEVRKVTRRAPRRLVGLGLLLGLLRPALLGQALILAGRTDPGLEVVLRSGRRIPLLLTALENASPLRRALDRAAGAAVA